MCVIMVCEKEKPTFDMLRLAEEANRDGAGISWREGGKIKFRKGLGYMKIWRMVQKLPLPFVIHFRLATVGKTKMLCHPFPVIPDAPVRMSGVSESVLFHNGHWSEWEAWMEDEQRLGTPIPTGPWSDSRLIAILLAHYGTAVFNQIPGKFALMTPTEILTFGGTWTYVNGVLCSNETFRYPRRITILPSRGKWETIYEGPQGDFGFDEGGFYHGGVWGGFWDRDKGSDIDLQIVGDVPAVPPRKQIGYIIDEPQFAQVPPIKKEAVKDDHSNSQPK